MGDMTIDPPAVLIVLRDGEPPELIGNATPEEIRAIDLWVAREYPVVWDAVVAIGARVRAANEIDGVLKGFRKELGGA